MSLCDGPAFIDRIRVIPLVSARSFGRFSLRDIAISTGEQPPLPDVPAPQGSAIDGAFTECPLPELQATADSVRSALASLDAIETFVGEKVGASSSTNFAKLTDVLRAADKILAARLARRGVGTESTEGGVVEGGSATGGGSGGPSISGEINSREDVIRVIDKICQYYERREPSSPIPLLLKRSKRLVSASFFDIVRDLAPDGLTQVENLRGKDSKDSTESS
jgi:type VI secretion system protein ImpA